MEKEKVAKNKVDKLGDKKSQELNREDASDDNKVSPSIKIIIGLLIGIILIALGYIFYQIGKKGVAPSIDKNASLMTSDDGSVEFDNSSLEDRNNLSEDSQDPLANNNEENSTTTTSTNSLSNDDLKKLQDELGDVSEKYDDLEDASIDLQNWGH